MAVTDSRLKEGVLTLGTEAGPDYLDFSCQATSVAITTSQESAGDAVTVLCGDALAEAKYTVYALSFTAIQDFEDIDGLIMYSWDHDGETIPFTWQPNATADVWSGEVQVLALTVGGEVAKRITSEAEWPCIGKPTHAPPAP